MTEDEIKAEVEKLVKEHMSRFTGYAGFWAPEDEEKMFPIDYEIEEAIKSYRIEKSVRAKAARMASQNTNSE